MEDASLDVTLETGTFGLRSQGTTTRTRHGNSGDEDAQIRETRNLEHFVEQMEDINGDLERAQSCCKAAVVLLSNASGRLLRDTVMKKWMWYQQLNDFPEDQKLVIRCHRVAENLVSNACRRILRMNGQVQESVRKDEMKELMEQICLSAAYRNAVSQNSKLNSSRAGTRGAMGRGGQASFAQPPPVINPIPREELPARTKALKRAALPDQPTPTAAMAGPQAGGSSWTHLYGAETTNFAKMLKKILKSNRFEHILSA